MQTLGQKFKATREAKGLTVEKIASDTRISAGYLRALESDDRAAFPGAFFYRSFIRQYAQILDLPEESYREELERSMADQEKMLQELPSQLPRRKVDVPPLPTGSGWNVEEAKRWALRVVALALVLLACTGAYQMYVRYQTPATEETKTAPAGEPAPTVGKAESPAQAAQSPTPPPQVALPEAAGAALPEAAAPKAEEAAPKAEPAAPKAAPAQPGSTPAVVAPATGSVQVRLTARELCWVDSWKGTQRYFSNALHPGQTQVLTGEPGMRVLFGNAGGVEIEFNGRAIPPAGPRGQVRTLEFGEGTYRVVYPPPKAETPPPQE